MNILLVLLISAVTCLCQKGPGAEEKAILPVEAILTFEKRIAEGVTPSIALAVIDSSADTGLLPVL